MAKGIKLKYGQLPAKKAEIVPWNQLCVDLVGPYKFQSTFQTKLGRRKILMKYVCFYDRFSNFLVQNGKN